MAWLGVGGGYTHIYIYKQTVLKLLERPAGARPKKNFLQKKTKKKTTATLFSLLFSWKLATKSIFLQPRKANIPFLLSLYG